MSGQPKTVVDALLAGPAGVAGVELRPLTMAGYLVLLDRGHQAVRVEAPELSHAEWLELAYVLGSDARAVARAHREGEERWAEEVLAFADGVRLDEMPALREAVQRELRGAFAAAPPPTGGGAAETDEKKKDGVNDLLARVRNHRAGNGWALSLLDLVWANYGWSCEAALYETPLRVLFLAYRQRAVVWESKGVPTIQEQEAMAQNKDLWREVLSGGR